MGKQYFCDYCHKGFADNLGNRKKHINSLSHSRLKKQHYDAFRNPKDILAEELAKKPCNAFMTNGWCKFGEACCYSHLNTERRQELQNRIDTEKVIGFTKSALPEYSPTLDEWLVKNSDITNLSQNSGDVTGKKISEHLPQPIAPCLSSYPNLPPSLLPIPPGALSNLSPLDWG